MTRRRLDSTGERLTAALAAARAGRGPDEFALFEVRGSIVGDDLAIDGGCRCEPAGDAAGSSAFAVALGPAALDPLRDGAPRWPSQAREEWEAAVEFLDVRLREAAAEGRRRAALLLDALREAGAEECEVRPFAAGRWRTWRGGGGEAGSELALGAGVRATWRGVRGAAGEAGAVDLLFGSEPDGALHVAARSALRDPFAGTGGLDRPIDPAPPGPREGGPIVLLPGAAAWLVHELGHAALERDPAREPPRSWCLVDDPGGAPWPVGFHIDDAGQAAQARDLCAGAPVAARRRGSIREPALPAMSRTLWRPARPPAATGDRAPWPQDPGTFVVESCSSGRFDPESGSVLLAADRTAERRGAGWVRRGPATVVIRVDQGWPDLCALGPDGDEPPRVARCSRGGSTLRVMVGAPTLMLNHAQVWPAEIRAGRAGRPLRAR